MVVINECFKIKFECRLMSYKSMTLDYPSSALWWGVGTSFSKSSSLVKFSFIAISDWRMWTWRLYSPADWSGPGGMIRELIVFISVQTYCDGENGKRMRLYLVRNGEQAASGAADLYLSSDTLHRSASSQWHSRVRIRAANQPSAIFSQSRKKPC